MEWFAKDFKKDARLALKGHYWKACLASLIASALGATSGMVSFSNVNFNLEDTDVARTSMPDEALPIIITIAVISVLFVLVIGVGFFFLGSIVKAGYSKFNIELVHYNNPQLGTMFAYFPNWKRMVYTNFLLNLRVLLWSFLFVIPGIIEAYSYRMTFYILAENPNLSAKEALAQSKKMMKGNKWRLFCLEFSFIGWILLSMLTFGIGMVFLAPYMITAEACFYKVVSEKQEGIFRDFKDQIPLPNKEHIVDYV